LTIVEQDTIEPPEADVIEDTPPETDEMVTSEEPVMNENNDDNFVISSNTEASEAAIDDFESDSTAATGNIEAEIAIPVQEPDVTESAEPEVAVNNPMEQSAPQ